MIEYKTLDCGCKIEIRGYTPEGRPRYYIDLEKLPDCPKVWELLASGRTKGIFQLEQGAGTKWCRELKPENKEHLCALAAVIRPGSTKSIAEDGLSMTDHFCRRKNGLEEIVVYHPALEEILAKTYQTLSYQEQSISIAVKIAGFTPEEADALRKAIGKKLANEMAKLKDKFIQGCITVGLVNQEQAEFIFAWIEKSQRYSFNKAHAWHYGVYGYKTAYLKTHAPRSFFKSWLEKADNIEEISDLIEDSKYFDIKIHPPDIRRSDKISFFIDNDEIYFGLGNVKSVSVNDAKTLQAFDPTWKTKDWNYFLFFLSDKLSATAMNRWIEVGAFRVFNIPRQEMLYQYNQVWKELGSAKNAKFDRRDFIREAYLAGKISTLAEGVALVASGLKKDGGGCHRKDDIQKFRDMHHLLINPAVQRSDTPDWIAWCEEEYLGSALTCSKVDSYGALHTTCTCLEFVRGYKGYTVVTAELKGMNEIEIKKGDNAGDPMAFVKISDGSCTMDGVVFTQVLKEYKPLLVPGQVLAFQGERTKKGTFQVLKVAPAAGV